VRISSSKEVNLDTLRGVGGGYSDDKTIRVLSLKLLHHSTANKIEKKKFQGIASITILRIFYND
jgi:hypothetical protein